MKTQTAERIDMRDTDQSDHGPVAVFAPPRLPFHDAIKQRFDVDRGAWKVLTEAIFPAAKSSDAIVMALAYCKARSLDVMKRPVHIVPMWSSSAGRMVETVWPGIAELRTTAFRTGNYAGCDEAEFGPPVKQTFTGKVKGKEGWQDKTVEVEFPEWARVTIYRALNGNICKFVGPKVKWLESYATIGNSNVPNDMWAERPEGQLEKCAEAAALRRAFPEEIGNELTAEEMHGRSIDISPAIEEPPAPPTPPPPVKNAPPIAGEVIPPSPKAKPAIDIDPDMPEAATNPVEFIKWLDAKLATFANMEAVESYWNEVIDPAVDLMFPSDAEDALGVFRKHERRLAP